MERLGLRRTCNQLAEGLSPFLGRPLRLVCPQRDKDNRTVRTNDHGHPAPAIADLVNSSRADLLVMGSHGHRGLKDLLFGATVDAVRHRVKVPVLVVK